MVMSKCPGQDTRYWKFEDIKDVECHNCGKNLEFLKTDIKRKCPQCHKIVTNPNFNLECAAWCSFAEQCIGEIAKGMGAPDSLKKKLEEEVEKKLKKEEAEKILKYVRKAWDISQREGTEFLIAALTIIYKLIKDEYGEGEGKKIFQEIRKRAEVPRMASDEAVQVLEDLENENFKNFCARTTYEALYDQKIELEEEKESKKGEEGEGEEKDGKVKRKIIKIDEDLCDGCGLCVPACAEGAIQIVDGKAKLVSEIYCDGLGDCLGECPQGAITIEEREADLFDEKAVEEHLEKLKEEEKELEGCPSCQVSEISREERHREEEKVSEKISSQLTNWPVKIKLVPPEAPFLKNQEIVISADCVPFAFGDFHRKFLKGKPLLIGCPKLDDKNMYYERLMEIFKHNDYKKVIVVNMEIPCCSGLYGLVKKALEDAESKADLEGISIGVEGDIK